MACPNSARVNSDAIDSRDIAVCLRPYVASSTPNSERAEANLDAALQYRRSCRRTACCNRWRDRDADPRSDRRSREWHRFSLIERFDRFGERADWQLLRKSR